MSKFLVLGTGQQGSHIATLLAHHSADSKTHKVVLAGIDEPVGLAVEKSWGDSSVLKFQKFNVEDINGSTRHQIGTWFQTFDVIVGAVPSHLGEQCISLAVEYGANYVDLSFTSTDLTKYDSLARLNKCTVIPDCGLAPGLPNILIGHLISELSPGEKLDDVKIYVGGVAEKQEDDYTITWSPEDLYEEYTRPARYLVDGKVATAQPLSKLNRELYTHKEPGAFQDAVFEAFASDGLRSLLSLRNIVPNMVEKTLRWPGHLDEVYDLIEKYQSKEACVPRLKEKYGTNKKDCVYLSVECGSTVFWLTTPGIVSAESLMNKSRFSLAMGRLSAMTITTAGTCAAVAMVLAENKSRVRTSDLPDPSAGNMLGVVMPEVYFSNKENYHSVMNKLKRLGIEIMRGKK